MSEKYILITGASKGIGQAIAVKLASAGYNLVLHARKEENLVNTINMIGASQSHKVLSADFSDDSELKNFLKELKTKYKNSLHGVINNAGLSIDKPIAYQPEQQIDAMLKVNLKAPLLIGKLAMKLFLVKKKGVIINIGSCIGETGNAFQSVYAATKAGLVAAAKSWAKEAGELLTDHQVRVLSVSPGFIETEMTDQITKEVREKYKQQIPAHRYGKADEVAALVAFLLSDQSPYMNGSEIKINGGLI